MAKSRFLLSQDSMLFPVFTFGISGATWEIIGPLCDQGRLPNLKQLMSSGYSARLASVKANGDKHFRPEVAWAALATGRLPDKHGITRFYHTAAELKSPPIWDIYQQQGLSVGLYGCPVTWPPPKINGFVIPSHRARDCQTWPPELSSIKLLHRRQQFYEREAERRMNMPIREGFAAAGILWRNGVPLRTLLSLGVTAGRLLVQSDCENRFLMLRHAMLDMSAAVFVRLCSRFKPNLASFHTFLVDVVSHRYWRYYDPQNFPETTSLEIERFGNAIPDAYEKVDRVLGRLLRLLPHNTIVAVLSEHGMQAEPVSNEVGPWRYVIRGSRLQTLVRLPEDIEPCPVARWIAYRPRPGLRLPKDTAERLGKVIVVETGLPLFQVYQHSRDEVIVKFNIHKDVSTYRNGNLEDLHIQYETCQVPFLDVARRLGRQRSAMHAEEGILILSGPNIRRGEFLGTASVLDFAPTILHAVGLPEAAKTDGSVLDVFSHNR